MVCMVSGVCFREGLRLLVLIEERWDISGVFSVCGFCHSALQAFKSVCGAWTCIVCMHKLQKGYGYETIVFTMLGTAVRSSLHSGVVVLL